MYLLLQPIVKQINIKDYTYPLPDEKIALFPLPQRDQSKLLVYNKGTISHRTFYEITDLLPPRAVLFLNNTKVIPARLHFAKDTGAQIEIFLLSPHVPSEINKSMHTVETCTWKCMIGNLKRWKKGTTLKKELPVATIRATLVHPEENLVEFSWSPPIPFIKIIEHLGEIPLPPYIQRKAEETDKVRYQTIYSRYAGAVAAPTAGLHFTESIMSTLKEKDVLIDFLTLHVGAGTFQPVKMEDAAKHVMHGEQIILNRKNLEYILTNRQRVAVGTTSMRTLESVYWYGVKLLKDPEAQFLITQHDPYDFQMHLPSLEEAVGQVISYMERKNLSEISGYSSIYIMPGYSFKVCDALITNFHQPGSTLILLVAAFIGEDWKKVYREALDHEYRFLSYGDSSLLIPTK